MDKEKDHVFPSELRLDLASQDWVVIATGRAKRPETFKKEKTADEKTPTDNCPFCQIKTQELPKLILVKGQRAPVNDWNDLPDDWTVAVIPNKYPAFSPHPHLDKEIEGGIYQKMNAVGFHEVVVFKDHVKTMADFTVDEVKEIFDAYQLRYLELMSEKFVNHISIFHNHGKTAGASISHPHSQIITTPLIDIDLKTSLAESKAFTAGEQECVYCRMNEWEIKSGKRMVSENDDFLAVCPFASKTAFQVIISPKKHLPYFEKITEKEKEKLSEIFLEVMKKISKGLGSPDYNFYLHTAPCDGENHDYYHWHWTILPKTSTMAGFEIGTRMEISTIEPEKAAEYLRSQ